MDEKNMIFISYSYSKIKTNLSYIDQLFAIFPPVSDKIALIQFDYVWSTLSNELRTGIQKYFAMETKLTEDDEHTISCSSRCFNVTRSNVRPLWINGLPSIFQTNKCVQEAYDVCNTLVRQSKRTAQIYLLMKDCHDIAKHSKNCKVKTHKLNPPSSYFALPENMRTTWKWPNRKNRRCYHKTLEKYWFKKAQKCKFCKQTVTQLGSLIVKLHNDQPFLSQHFTITTIKVQYPRRILYVLIQCRDFSQE